MVPLVSFAIALALLVVPAAHATADSFTLTTVVVLQKQGFTSVDLGSTRGRLSDPRLRCLRLRRPWLSRFSFPRRPKIRPCSTT